MCAGDPGGSPVLPAGRMPPAEGGFPGVTLSLRLCSGVVKKGIKDHSKLLSVCLSLSSRYSYVSAERICLSLGLLFTSARGVSSKNRGGVLVCNHPAASHAGCDGQETWGWPAKACCLIDAWESGLDRDRHMEQLSRQGADRPHGVITAAEEPVITLYFEGCL